ncbi:hypothetical protein [Kitasatospora sp. NPDC093806]|uniref:hypothetical protein n=1 Tax=Kitasatospora sp. NPDC093806 TaxID=3155075 RepID=UPI00342F6657
MDIAEYLRAKDEREWQRARNSRYRVVQALGLLALGGWLWAVGLAFLPVSHEFRNGNSVDCGSPVFFDATANTYQGDTCSPVVGNRMRGAVGVGLATFPFSVAWLGWTVSIRLQRVEERA